MHEKAAFAMEAETEKVYEMTCIAPDGLGYGEGSISSKERETDAEYNLTQEQLQRAIELVIEHESEVIAAVDEDDDGCGDGRPADRVFQVVDDETGEIREYRVSKKRAKIFGGGLQVAASMWRAVEGAPVNAETVLGDRMFIADELKNRDLHYGAHTDNHAHGDNCGCGAIDKYPQSTRNSGVYHDQILATLPAFYGEAFEDQADAISQAFATRAEIAQNEQYMSDAAGRTTMDFIESDGAVVKELADGHLEVMTIVNTKPNTTVDQTVTARIFAEASLPEGIQVFVIDAWRGEMYADAVADIAVGHGYDRKQAHDVAMADFYINQLAVAATLTDGSQPVLVNK